MKQASNIHQREREREREQAREREKPSWYSSWSGDVLEEKI